jgi:hypothetical protein
MVLAINANEGARRVVLAVHAEELASHRALPDAQESRNWDHANKIIAHRTTGGELEDSGG